MPHLFSPLTIKDVTLKNRIALSPMSQYSCRDGKLNDWHLVHLGARAVGGAGLIVTEVAAVSPEARVSPEDFGFWNDEQVESCRPVVDFVKRQNAVIGVQLGHSGRMGGCQSPWNGNDFLAADDPRDWECLGPGTTPVGPPYSAKQPRAATLADIANVKADFVAAASRALEAGFDWLELHFAHSYLLQNFFSPLVNNRTDRYGGDFEGRARLLIEIVEEVRAVWPERLPLTARLGVKDHVEGEQPLEEGIELVRCFGQRGLDLIDVSIGVNRPSEMKMPWSEEGFMLATAARIRAETGVLTATSWNIRNPAMVDEVIAAGKMDLLMLGRPLLADPHWPARAARKLGRDQPHQLLPVQYAAWLRDDDLQAVG